MSSEKKIDVLVENQLETPYENSTSLMCTDTRCSVRMAGYKGKSGNAELFVCECVSNEVVEYECCEEQGIWTESTQERIDSGELVELGGTKPTTVDTAKNIRVVDFDCYKCKVSFGDGINIHCELCNGPVVSYLRDIDEKEEKYICVIYNIHHQKMEISNPLTIEKTKEFFESFISDDEELKTFNKQWIGDVFEFQTQTHHYKMKRVD